MGLGSSSASTSTASIPSHAFETPRRTQTYGRKPEELHIPSSSNIIMSQQTPKELLRQHSYHSSHEFPSSMAPGINIHQATPQGRQFSSTSSSSNLPGALQPGRPGPPSINTAPATVPTLPQTPSHSQQQSSARSPSLNQAHVYSRSSPAGLEQKYAPFTNTPETTKYGSTPTQKYTSQTPKGEASYSPLGLADIRPHIDSGLSDTPSSANPYSNNGLPSVPTNSNYLAPWAVYAFDWCKWPVQKKNSSDGAGKMAIGSYVDDGHNFVGHTFLC